MTEKNFKISSALKDIIGRELITDDFIAVFELVKNSFDANAKRVDVIFKDLTTDNPKLIIKDNGKGMDKHDLEDKWLFVAYSAKKIGKENYRDKISKRRIHAGAKGIGRFSCDRLGKSLVIYSKKKSKITTLNRLKVDWEDFEKDMEEEFISVDVDYSITKSNPYKISVGTALEIQGLRDSWDRDKLLKLKRSLEKLINPNQDNDSKGFSIYLDVKDEFAADKRVKQNEPWDKVNGKIENFIFEKLGLKTTQIHTQISSDGSEIQTSLVDRGDLVYKIREDNPFVYNDKFLSDISIHLFSLNQSAKATFTRHMGVDAVNFGSVFVYKNGFRIHPIGDIGEGDIFALDRRKGQGTSRFFGTRDLIGRIEINGLNSDFQETSSRDGGLIKNTAFELLSELFLEYALKRLEKYAIDVIKFGNTGDLLDKPGSSRKVVKSKVMEIIEKLTKPKSVIDIEYNPKFLDILGEVSEKSLKSIINNFSRIAQQSDNLELEKQAKRAKRRLAQLEKAKDEAEKQFDVEKEKRQQAEEEARKQAEKARTAEKEASKQRRKAEQKTKETLFLKSITSSDLTNVVSLHHHIGIAAGTIENYVRNTVKHIKSGKPFTSDDFIRALEKISYNARKISTTANFATKANFNLSAEIISADLCAYIEEYIFNICDGLIKTHDNKKNIEFVWKSDSNKDYITKFRPFEISVIIDSLISNARKAKATKIHVEIDVRDNMFEIFVKDNGVGIKAGAKNKLFDLGYTTTNGSGMGLFHVFETVRELKGSIEVVKGLGSGAGFLIKLKR